VSVLLTTCIYGLEDCLWFSYEGRTVQHCLWIRHTYTHEQSKSA